MDGCPGFLKSCLLPPPSGVDLACSAAPGPLIGPIDEGCSLWVEDPARMLQLAD